MQTRFIQKPDRLITFLNPWRIVVHLSRHRGLIGPLTRRELQSRYKGSILGLFWTFIQPLLLLAVYTFVFSVIFKTRWGVVAQDEGRLGFALALFAGILTFSIIGDVLSAAPGIILGHANFVKRVVFPLEILPLVKLLGTVIHALTGMTILILVLAIDRRHLNGTLILLPVVWLPVLFFSLGWAYFFSSLGVFIRDLGATIQILVTVLFFLSPIFYPLEAVPERFRFFCRLNPVANFVENTRLVVLGGSCPDWGLYAIHFAVSLIIFTTGFIWFMKSRKAFADVL